ncbi:Vacuolar protein sorting-associated protein 26 [Histomonas meleagridis]|uniref:Vacuolar protein sorting-associated protein 26 n=1 Tax=Histomonas meleagridis TaxID=135588 RepID=UPI00355A84C1|nr:Vacuolar protein sorting-associated protein 26 [Histomonas meleagridis]KAH0806005.1 Vacuolar protein sorting-associated protein 26 [Histomonas meleagridis]
MSPQKIRPIDLVNLSCQLSLPKLEYSNNEKIEGQLVFVSPQERNILMMTAHLYVSEQLGSSPTINTQIFSYELVNGNPLPGTQIPFCLQLGSKKIWTFHPITDKKNTLVKADFKLEIETKTTTGTIRNFVKLNIYQNHFDDDDDINK